MNSTATGLPKTRDLVKHYAAQLLDAGAEVSVATIRARILEEHGVTASPNVVSDEVRQFWARTGPLLSARLRRPGIPESVCQVLDSVWEVALNEATRAFAIERTAAVREADQANARATVAQDEAEQARGRFTDQEFNKRIIASFFYGNRHPPIRDLKQAKKALEWLGWQIPLQRWNKRLLFIGLARRNKKYRK